MIIFKVKEQRIMTTGMTWLRGMHYRHQNTNFLLPSFQSSEKRWMEGERGRVNFHCEA